jgi:deazaflavin-dependent oxidoreductase (nitroreductase family)
MSFDTTAGTRGRRQRGTGGPVGRWIQKRMVNRVRRTGRAMGNDGLVLTTIGRKSGTERTTAVMCFPGEDGSWLIVASAAGAAKNPAWYYNIAAHPDKVQNRKARPQDSRDGRTASRVGPGTGMAADHQSPTPLRELPAEHRSRTTRDPLGSANRLKSQPHTAPSAPNQPQGGRLG